MTSTRRRGWSKSIGERGHRIRLYEARPGGPLMRSIWMHGKEDRKSLGHRDRARATREAYEFLSGLAVTEKALEEERLTLGLVQELYLQSVQHLGKQARTQQHDAQKLRRVVAFLGPNRDVASLSESDLWRYTMVRRTGAATLAHVAIGRTVRDRTVEADLKLLVGALHWATRERTSTGRRLLREHPLVGVRLPKRAQPPATGNEPRGLCHRARGGAGGPSVVGVGPGCGGRNGASALRVAQFAVGRYQLPGRDDSVARRVRQAGL